MRVALRVSGLLLLVVCLSGAGTYLFLRQSLPNTEGEIELAGLRATVEVLRDRHGVPHIYASSLEDAHFALGFMRTLGLRRVAEANLRRYDAETRRLLDAYAAGVNAFLARRPVLPPEFWLLGLIGDKRPEPWSAADSIVWTKVMAWDLGGNWRAELLRMRLSRTLALERIHEFLAPYPGDPPPRIAELKGLYSGMEKKLAPERVFSQQIRGQSPNLTPILLPARTAG